MKKQLEELIRQGYEKQAEIKLDDYNVHIYRLAYNKLWYCPETDKVLMKYCMMDKMFKKRKGEE